MKLQVLLPLIGVLLLVGASVSADQTTATRCALPCGAIPLGKASENAETSRAIETILRRCLAAHAASQTYSARGLLLAQLKLESGQTVIRQQRLEIAFERPSRVAVTLADLNHVVSQRFVADGRKVLKVWDPQNRLWGGTPDKLVYSVEEQPHDLSLYVEEENNGDLYEDGSGLAFSAPVPLLISRDPYAWLQAKVIEQLYEGAEEVAGHCCHRICFLQEGPPLAVTLWIDCETGLLRKQTVVKAETEKGTPAWAMATAGRGLLVEVLLDEISTHPAKLVHKFDTTPPGNVQNADVAAPPSVPQPSTEGSFFRRVLRAAVADKLDTTSATIANESPVPRWRVAQVHHLQARVTDVHRLGPKGLFFLLADGAIWHMGATQPPRRIPTRLDFVPTLVAGAQDTQEIFATLAAKGKPWLALINLSGQVVWQRRLPRLILGVECVNTGSTTATLCVAHGDGYSCVDLQGRTGWSFRSEEDLRSVLPALHPSRGEVFVGLLLRNPTLELFAPCGRPLEQLHLDDPLIELAAPSVPCGGLFLVGALSLRDNEYVLRGVGPAGETLWTTPIAANLEQMGGGFTEVRTHDPSSSNIHFLAVTPAGRLREVDAQGRLFWEGQIRIDVPPAVLAGLSFGDRVVNVDFDGDGQDEVLLFADKKLLYLVPLPGPLPNSR